MRPLSLPLSVILLGIVSTQSVATAQEPEPTEPATEQEHPVDPETEPATGPKAEWEQLLTRPELWPTHCKLLDKQSTPGEEVGPGTLVRVVDLDDEDNELVVQIEFERKKSKKKGYYYLQLPYRYTDILETAEREAAALSPEQLALTYETLAERVELWPEKVTMVRPHRDLDRELIDYLDEPDFTLDDDYYFGCLDGSIARLWHEEDNVPTSLPAWCTDLMTRARQALADGATLPSKGRVLAQLEGNMIDLGKKGRDFAFNKRRPPKYYLLFFSTGLSGLCRQFAPSLVDFYDRNREAGKSFEVIFISRDKSRGAMEGYAESEGFEWITVPYMQLSKIRLVQAYAHSDTPHLLVLDADGRVLIDSYRDGKYIGASSALTHFEALLEEDQKAKRGR